MVQQLFAGKTEKVTITAEDIKAAEEDIKAFTQAQEGLANLVKEVKDTDGSVKTPGSTPDDIKKAVTAFTESFEKMKKFMNDEDITKS